MSETRTVQGSVNAYLRRLPKCETCKRPGLTLDDAGLCHECWQDEQDAAQAVEDCEVTCEVKP